MLYNIYSRKRTWIAYLVLIFVTLTVFYQVYKFDFVYADDGIFIQENYVLSGITLDGLKWAFSTTYAGFWHPLTWLSFMVDHHLYGLNAGGYHITNLTLHLLSVLLLFSIFNRMTRDVWKSAFVTAVFAIHPMNVESVTWIAERKDVLSAFFWMLTLYLYIYYTENPSIRRYVFVLFCFACALMSKPMVVTMPLILMLLDYWPLDRFASGQTVTIIKDSDFFTVHQDKQKLKWEFLHKGWFLWEKIPFFILSALFSIITISIWHNPSVKDCPFIIRLYNGLHAFLIYLKNILWMAKMHFYHPFTYQIPFLQVLVVSLLIIIISLIAIVAMKRFPYLFVGWFWYVITILPVIGIMPYGISWIHEHYTYLPSIGISMIMGWGIPRLFYTPKIRKIILLPAGIVLITFFTILSYQRCSYWEDSLKLFSYALQNHQDDYLAYNSRGSAYFTLGQYQRALYDFNAAIRLAPDVQMIYNNRGVTLDVLGQHQRAVMDFNKSMQLNPDDAAPYFLRGNVYYNLGQYHLAIRDYDKSIDLNSKNTHVFLNRGAAYFKLGNQILGCRDAQQACDSGRCELLGSAKASGYCR